MQNIRVHFNMIFKHFRLELFVMVALRSCFSLSFQVTSMMQCIKYVWNSFIVFKKKKKFANFLYLLKSVMWKLPVSFFLCVNTMWICITMVADFQCFLLQICKSIKVKSMFWKNWRETLQNILKSYTELVLYSELLNQVCT